ncbi:prenyltransferase/squalene oxidase repeat-containing protein [Kitasatospora sp. CB02891]|uniref:prenyltransferase/squalene oxidase repeat-containing protein n=1 Tax=Kitasatospora sp. CB02891 TaxID=2020329 RepID=UPI000C27C8E5|nr:prenyltransferase/squalene oxidase repeat-containing protein [Kitasatospora sp. CB02891]PJN25652.1 peptidase [Kitasatospora sp. CB02891]
MRVNHSSTSTHPSRTRGRRPAAALLATLVAAATTGTLLLGHPGTAAADPVEQCTATTGAIVAVDFSPWGGGLVRGCDAHPTTGMNLLHNAGFTTAGTVHDGPGFICRIGTGAFATGTQYPTAATEPCTTTPQGSAYWSYWIAEPGATAWTYSRFGADGQKPKAGEVEAWVYGATDLGGTTGGPKFTPDEVRAKNAASPSPSPSPSASGGPSGSPSPSPGGSSGTGAPPGRTADPAAAAAWLAAQLTDGDHMENWAFEGPDFPRTALTALSLAGSGTQDAALRKVAAFLAAHADAFLFPNGASAGAAPDARAAALLALVAEATGGDPRSFGGRDLVAALTDHVCDAAGQGGKCSAAGDFQGAANPWTQAMGVIALARAGVVPAPAVLDRFAGVQCADGGFAGTLIRPGQYCESDPLSTAETVIALRLAGGHQPVADRGVAWLTAQQGADGAFVPYAGASPETLSTAVAAQALHAAGRTAEADRATAWLAARQNADGGLGPDEWTPDSEAPATEQAILALTGTDPATVLRRVNAPQPARTPDLARAGAYLTDRARLIDGHYYEGFTDFADFGLTIDTAYALAATGTDDAALRRITDFLDQQGKDRSERSVNDWTAIGTEWAGGGSVAKEALLAEIVGRDPRHFGGQDLITALDRMVCDHADVNAGCDGPGNYQWAQSVFSQALGVMAQVRAGHAEQAGPAVAYLRGLQNADGSWPSLIPNSRTPDVDSTAIAAMALDLLPDRESRQAVERALGWLAARQLPDGGFPGSAGNSVNSAALAVQGLSLRQDAYAARIARATEFLAGQQNADGGFTVAADGPRTSDLRASAQAAGGVTGRSFGTLSHKLDDSTPGEPSGSPSPSSSASPSASASAEPTGSPSPSRSTSGGTVVDTSTGGGSTSSGLAFTGTDVLELVVPGLLLTVGGGAVLVAFRRRAKADGGSR